MAVRPPQIRYLTEGKAIGAAIHKGFAATWNWLLAWVNFFKAGKGLKLSDTGSGHPRLDVQLEPGDGIDVSCGGVGQPYIISLVSQGGGGGGDSPDEPDEPWDPDEPWNPDDPWNPPSPSGPGGGGGGGGGFDPSDPWDPDDPWNPDDEEEEDEDEDKPDPDHSCNEFSQDEEEQDLEDPGMDNEGDDCKILNGW